MQPNGESVILDPSKTPPHQSIFLEEFLSLFQVCNLRSFIDATLGAGGHSQAILKAHPEIQTWIGIDRDESALELAKARLFPLLQGKSAHFLHEDFLSASQNMANLTGLQGVDGIFLDIGVSSMQLDRAERGFSFRQDGPLDMRMDSSQSLSAYDLVNRSNAKELERIFRDYGEEPRYRKAAQMIIQARQKRKLTRTSDLTSALDGLWQGSHKHPATRIFQALRIAVNSELEQLEKSLPLWMDHLNPGGRLGVISFHSLEDRIVKICMKERAKQPGWKLVFDKPLEASAKEIRKNPRSRSAKLRFIEKLATVDVS